MTQPSSDRELAALKGAADGERFGKSLAIMQAYSKAFVENARAAIAGLEGVLAQMPHAPAETAAGPLSGPGEGEPSQSADTATEATGGARDTTGGQP